MEGLEQAIDSTVAAVILEPVQGMSGARAVDPHLPAEDPRAVHGPGRDAHL